MEICQRTVADNTRRSPPVLPHGNRPRIWLRDEEANARCARAIADSPIRCRIMPYLIKAAPRGAAGPASAAGSALVARPPHAGPHPQGTQIEVTQPSRRPVQRVRLLGCPLPSRRSPCRHSQPDQKKSHHRRGLGASPDLAPGTTEDSQGNSFTHGC
jgi:hypothetical protein